jgi:uridylate kinase
MPDAQRSEADPVPPDAEQSGDKPYYHRAVIKLSGESLCKPGTTGIDGEELEIIAREIGRAHDLGTQLAIVVGGGNMIRGGELAKQGSINQATGDYMGMLGTAINGLALKEMLENLGHPARVLSALNLTSVAETFIRGRAIRHLEKGRIVIFVAGTGNPFFTTDSAAALRAAEINADVLFKATKVDGIYDKDPSVHADAKKYDRISFREAIDKQLRVMDLTAFSMCMERNIPIVVFNMKTPGHIAEVVSGKAHGTRVE